MTRIPFVISLVVTASLISCTTFRTIAPDKTIKDNSQTIKVFLLDGRVIKLPAGEYVMDLNSDAGYIQGSGVQSGAGENQEVRFTGSISRQSISGIQVNEPTGLTTTTGYVILGILSIGGLYLLLLLTSDRTH